MSDPEHEQYPDGIGVTTLEGTNALEDFSSEPPYKVNGVAIPENTVLNGGQGVDHFFPPEMAKEAAEVMQKQIDSDNQRVHLVSGFHEIEGQADPDEIVGEVTSAGYEKGVGVVFEAETIEEGVAERISHNYVDVSPTVARQLGEHDDTMGAQRVERVTGFRDVAIVGNGQPGASISPGSNPAVTALSMDALSRGFDVLGDDEPEEEEEEEVEDEPNDDDPDPPDPGPPEVEAVVDTVPVKEQAGGETVTLVED